MNTRSLLALAALALTLVADVAHAQTVTQTVVLRPGWNSIWLEVDPPDRTPSVVFADPKVEAVWTYLQDGTAVDFIADQAEEQFNKPGWLAWLPSKPAFLTTLFAIAPQRAYLVKASATATIQITGRPIIKDATWVPDSFNLRGFPINPDQVPTFASYFSGIAAHEAQRKYRLSATGTWELVNPTDQVQKGIAYWVFSSGASTVQGSLNLENLGDDSFDFSNQLDGLTALLRNNGGSASAVTITNRGGGASPLSVQGVSSEGITYTPLSAPFALPLAEKGNSDLRLIVRRRDFPAADFSTILEIKDNRGTLHLVGVTAGKLLTARASIDAPQPGNSANATHPGLWIGTVSVNKVNEVNSLTPEKITPTRSAFDLRVMLHVPESGPPRMLKEVIQMWQPSTKTTDAAGDTVVDKPGRHVLLTKDSLIPNFQGSSLRGGADVGRRLSTVDFDFDGGADNFLTMTGGFGGGQTATVTIHLAPGFATNPFYHKYHPDHDNLDANFTSLKVEAFAITRKLEFKFETVDSGPNAGATALDYGYDVLGGSYKETITGLHKRELNVSGTFRIRRVSNSPVLNQ